VAAGPAKSSAITRSSSIRSGGSTTRVGLPMSMDHRNIDPGNREIDATRKAENARRLFDVANDVPALIDQLGAKLGERGEGLIAELSSDTDGRF
jgi:hypothetical protein